ncbi:hypothetical protein D7X99_27110 [Corallococcus sp. AB032C]|nr:hypothetical protein D7X99_27110 [Corallococcus sp. AB032C]
MAAIRNLAIITEQAGNTAETISLYERILASDPTNEAALTQLRKLRQPHRKTKHPPSRTINNNNSKNPSTAITSNKAPTDQSTKDDSLTSRLPLTILHLTDLHFAAQSKRFPSAHYWNSPEWPAFNEPSYNQRGLLKSIIKDIRKNHWSPDLVIVSGDLLDRGQSSGVQLAIEFLTNLSEFLSLERSRFILVPGNHDEIRDATTPEERYSLFAKIWTGFYSDMRPWPHGRPAHEQVHIFDLKKELGLQVIGFNSCEGHDRGLTSGGAVGTNQRDLAESLLSQNGDSEIRIAVMHHHLYNPTGTRGDMAVMEGAPEIRSWLKNNSFQLAIHGHQHVDWAEEDSAGNWTLAVLAGASAGVGRYGREAWDLRVGYQVIQIDSHTGGRRFRRSYDPMSRAFQEASPTASEALRFGPRQSQLHDSTTKPLTTTEDQTRTTSTSADVDFLSSHWASLFNKAGPLNKEARLKIQNWLKIFPANEIADAMDTAATYQSDPTAHFRYTIGILRNKKRAIENPEAAELERGINTAVKFWRNMNSGSGYLPRNHRDSLRALLMVRTTEDVIEAMKSWGRSNSFDRFIEEQLNS